MKSALTFGVDPDAAVVALAGFLLRGGIVLLAAPSVVLPSAIGLAGITGVDAFGIDGRPTAWLFEMVAIAVGAVLVWLALASFVGAIIDVWLIEAVVDASERPVRQGRPLPNIGLVLDMVTVRGICFLPLASVLAWAGSRIYTATYNELTAPSNLVVPLPIRVVESAADAVILVVVVWLATETIAAVAVRRLVLSNAGVWDSLGTALVEIVRRPLSTALTLLASTGTSVVATLVAVAATATAFDWCRIVARNEQPIALTVGLGRMSTTRDFRPVVFVVAALLLAIAWLASAALSGVASAWRSAAWTTEAVDSLPNARIDASGDEPGLSGPTRERSGD